MKAHQRDRTWLKPLLFSMLLVVPLVARAVVLEVVLTNDPVLQSPTYLWADGTTLFASGIRPDNNQGVFKVPANGGAAVQLYPAFNPWELAIVGNNVFWIDPNSGPITDTQILGGPANGSGPITAIYTGSLVGQPIVDGTGLTTDGTTLYAADQVNGTVFSLDPDGSNLTQIGGARYGGFFDTEHDNSLAYDAGTLFIADAGKPSYGISPAVLSLPVTGSAYTTLVSGAPLVQPMGICVADGMIYISDPGANNTIWELPVTGGTPRPLFSGPPFQRIQGLVFFKGNLYVADPDAHTIYKLGHVRGEEGDEHGHRGEYGER